MSESATSVRPASSESPSPTAAGHGGDWPLSVRLLLNAGHAIDHMYLLVFAAAVGVIAIDFGFTHWEDLMPFGVGAFILFGVGALPAGRLGDLWGRRQMMLVFYFGMAGAMLLAALSSNAWQMAGALTVMGAFASIYHPVGIPMLVQRSPTPGMAIGINGLAGNLGVAVAALVTGFLVKWLGWQAAFIVPSLIAFACGLLFMHYCPKEVEPPAKGSSKARVQLPPKLLMRALLVLTMVAVSSNMLFNFTTNGNGQLMIERFKGVVEDPATLGTLLAVVYAIGALAQIVVGRLLDRVAVKPLFVTVVLLQIPFLLLASISHGWWLYAALIGSMAVIFGSIPFVDVVITRYVDDRIRSRVAGFRLAVSLGISALAVWILGPFVKSSGFDSLFMFMALISVCTFMVVLLLPSERAAIQTTAADDSDDAAPGANAVS